MADFAARQHPVNIEDEMKRSYMDYAMSVIIGRALPDARDGLKPAHRRVLYGMKTMGLSVLSAMRRAMVRRICERRTRSSSAMRTGFGLGCLRGGVGPRGGQGGLDIGADPRPWGPLPLMPASSRPCSAAMWRAMGDARTLPSA